MFKLQHLCPHRLYLTMYTGDPVFYMAHRHAQTDGEVSFSRS